VTVIVAVGDHRIGEMDVRQLVALPAGARDIGERERGDRLAACFAAGHRLREALDKLAQRRVLVAVRGVEQRAREHRQSMAQAGMRCGVTGAFNGCGVQGEKNAVQPRVLPQDQPFDAAVFEDLDRHALHRAEVVREQRCAPAAVTSDVRQARPVAVDPAHAQGVVEDVRQANSGRVVVGEQRRRRIRLR
jgi:hypothetical protein